MTWIDFTLRITESDNEVYINIITNMHPCYNTTQRQEMCRVNRLVMVRLDRNIRRYRIIGTRYLVTLAIISFSLFTCILVLLKVRHYKHHTQTAHSIKQFLPIAHCYLLGVYWCFGRSYCFYLQVQRGGQATMGRKLTLQRWGWSTDIMPLTNIPGNRC